MRCSLALEAGLEEAEGPEGAATCLFPAEVDLDSVAGVLSMAAARVVRGIVTGQDRRKGLNGG